MTPPPPTPDPTPKADSWATEAELHFIIGPNGMCRCGQDGKTCAELLQEMTTEWRKGDPNSPHGKELQRQALENRAPVEMHEPTAEERDMLGLSPAAPPQSDPALAAAEAIEYHNPDNLPSPGEAPWRFTIKGEYLRALGEIHWWDGECWGLSTTHSDRAEYNITYRTRRPLPVAPAPAPEGRGETAETGAEWERARKIATESGYDFQGWRERAFLMRDHANRLERERNRLRKKVAQYRADFENANYRNEEMRRERDAAVAQAQALREAVALMLDWYNSQPSREVINLNAAPTIHEWANHIAAALAASEAGK